MVCIGGGSCIQIGCRNDQNEAGQSKSASLTGIGELNNLITKTKSANRDQVVFRILRANDLRLEKLLGRVIIR